MDSMLASKQNAMQNDAIWELDFDEQLDPKNSHGFPQKELMMCPNVLMSRVIISGVCSILRWVCAVVYLVGPASNSIWITLGGLEMNVWNLNLASIRPTIRPSQW